MLRPVPATAGRTLANTQRDTHNLYPLLCIQLFLLSCFVFFILFFQRISQHEKNFCHCPQHAEVISFLEIEMDGQAGHQTASGLNCRHYRGIKKEKRDEEMMMVVTAMAKSWRTARPCVTKVLLFKFWPWIQRGHLKLKLKKKKKKTAKAKKSHHRAPSCVAEFPGTAFALVSRLRVCIHFHFLSSFSNTSP